eukprot:gb/GFBE01070664.1/.p1 GENE.gb/GFBE01070664.1/~~gb/GFBE01070664.1/.p1  ORF type:complete len:341 (+),score=86.00 gb/GFBE01070664.1/:1-1023(+)
MSDAFKYNFNCEHVEEASQMTKEFLLTVYNRNNGSPNEISLTDVKAKRLFLKRGVYDSDGPMRLEDMYIGGEITVCARKMKIVGYADTPTRQLFEQNCQQVYTVIRSAAYPDLGVLLTAAARSGFTIKRVKTLFELGSRSRCVHMELVGQGGPAGWLEAVSQSVGTASAAAVSAEPAGPGSEKVFTGKECTATFDSCSLCIVRPHAMREGKAGTVISALCDCGFEISAMQTYVLLKNQAENFYEVYKTVLPSAQYAAMISELASGNLLAIEVRGGDDVVPRLRELCGPVDVEIAKHLRPNTIRACHGRDNVHNVVHCTDLPEDGILECQYFFSILPTAFN